MLNNQTKVVIPFEILEKENQLAYEDFLNLVHDYLNKYQDYKFVHMEDGLAVCERLAGGAVLSDAKDKKSSHKRRIT